VSTTTLSVILLREKILPCYSRNRIRVLLLLLVRHL